jgi:hypothetical protein
MTILLASPIVLSCLVLAAHFLRGGQAALVAVCLALPLLFLVRRPWAGWTITVLLGLGSLEWLVTLAHIAQQRMAMEQPWLRMAAILGTVALITGASALLTRSRHLARHFSVDAGRAGAPPHSGD